MAHIYTEIESLSEFLEKFPHGETVRHCALQAINFDKEEFDTEGYAFEDCVFLGCEIPARMYFAMDNDCIVLPRIKMPFKVFSSELYTPESLYRGYDYRDEETSQTCYDTITYEHFMTSGKYCEDIKETLARVLHDHSIADAMRDFLSGYDEKNVVAVMGGHMTLRDSEEYRKVAKISKILTEKGKLMVSGGGPGSMEAVHLGAWMAGRSDEEFEDALSVLSKYTSFKDPKWLSSAFYIRGLYPQRSGFKSLGIPTFLYGHEPTTPFATHIAKFFDNSIREDFIVSRPMGGIIYTPGGAGTFQEIFQDAAQNHYETLGYASPMVFLGKEYYTEEVPIYPLLTSLQEKGRYKNLILSIADEVEDIVDSIMSFK